MMKSTSAPRRVYKRNSVTHVLYAGEVFGTKDSALRTDVPVRIAGNGDGTITVTQRLPKRKGVSETWSPVKVPSKSRA